MLNDQRYGAAYDRWLSRISCRSGAKSGCLRRRFALIGAGALREDAFQLVTGQADDFGQPLYQEFQVNARWNVPQ